MRSFIKTAIAVGTLAVAGLITPASAHSPVLLAPGQMVGGGWLNGPDGPMHDPTSPGSASIDGTLVLINLDASVTQLDVRMCADDACGTFVQAEEGGDKVVTHEIAPGNGEEVVTDGFDVETGTFRVDTNGAAPAFGIFVVAPH